MSTMKDAVLGVAMPAAVQGNEARAAAMQRKLANTPDKKKSFVKPNPEALRNAIKARLGK